MTREDRETIVGMIKAEWISLRSEQEFLKRCQLQYFLFSITAIGVFLGLLHRDDVQSLLENFPAIFLSPLLIILPSWWIFFDKAKTIARIVGYLKVLEFLLLSDCPEYLKKFKGWERSLAHFRRRYEMNILRDDRPETIYQNPSPAEFALKILRLRSTHKFWSMHFITFASVSVVCLLLSIGVFQILQPPYKASIHDVMFGWIPLTIWVATFILSYKIYRHNFDLLMKLIYGRNSYDAHEYAWRKILELPPPDWVLELSEAELQHLGLLARKKSLI